MAITTLEPKEQFVLFYHKPLRLPEVRMEKFILLQDLVKSQNDQLLHIRRLLDETMFRNDLLLDELEGLQREMQPGEAPRSPHTPPESSTHPHAPVNPTHAQNDATPSVQTNSDETEDAIISNTDSECRVIPFFAFHGNNEGPWKYLKIAKKGLKSPKSATMLVVGDELSFEDVGRNAGFLVKPKHVFFANPEGKYERRPYYKLKRTKGHQRIHEMIWHSGPNYFYLGTYETSFSKVLKAGEFEELPPKMKKEVYRLASNHVKKTAQDLGLPSMYQRGELEALQMNFRRIDFNEEFNRLIFEAAGLPLSPTHEVSPSNSEPGPLLGAADGAGNKTNAEGDPPSEVESHPAHSDENLSVADLPLTEAFTSITQSTDMPCVYQLKSSPKKKLKNAVKTGIIQQPKPPVKISVKLEELVFNLHDTQFCFEIVPMQQLGSKKRGFLASPFDIENHMTGLQEIIVRRKLRFYHLGTYKPVSVRALTPVEFERLSIQTKQRVYLKSLSGNEKKLRELHAAGVRFENKFASGEFQGAWIEYGRVGLNTDVQRFLGELVAQGL
ncbi:hypothetical protein FPV67DRAFT_1663139 [Lyophyllum atratum]|nr:hypothetical protein FPV67DRAFT_1663139 [Lyophyllum atratum]